MLNDAFNVMIPREWRAAIMRKTPTSRAKGKKNRPKIKLGIPDLEHSKAAVLPEPLFSGLEARISACYR